MAPTAAQRRKAKKRLQEADVSASSSASKDGKPAAPTAAVAARKADLAKPAAAIAQPTEAPPAVQAAAALAALLLLLFAHQAAVRLLAPQTGEWLASSFCSLALYAAAIAAAVLGHSVQTIALLFNVGSGKAAPDGITPAAWWLAAGSALLTALLRPDQLAGRLLLAPGLADGRGRRISDAQLTLCAMGTALLAFGPLFAALGCAAGASASRALLRLAPGSRPLLAVLPLLTTTAAAGMVLGLPATLLPSWPGSTLPPALAAAAAFWAAVLSPRQDGKLGSKAVAAAVCIAGIAAALVAAALRQPCTTVNRQLHGGRYSVLWRCELAAGGQLSVVEGTLQEQYRYRLLRLDHSVMGGEYVAPPEVAGQSVYSAFYLQQAAALLLPSGSRSLHVGLGIGTSIKAMQRLGVAADAIELHPEVQYAAQHYFGLQPSLHGGRALVGDAAQLVPRLAAEGGPGYDYVLHDVFSSGGIAPPLMDRPFFRQLRSVLAPGGVLAVNYYGGRGASLKQAWCRLRLEFESVRTFSDIEKSRLRNHVLFASDSDLSAVNLTAALAAAEARATAIQAAAESAAGSTIGSSAGQQETQQTVPPPEVLDPLQLRVWRSLPQQEMHLTYDRQRCEQLLEVDGTPTGHSGGSGGSGSFDPSEAAAARRRSSMEKRAAGHAAKTGALGKLGQARRQQAQQAQQRGQQRPPWIWRKVKEVRERHALAVGHWVAMRTGWSDDFWLD